MPTVRPTRNLGFSGDGSQIWFGVPGEAVMSTVSQPLSSVFASAQLRVIAGMESPSTIEQGRCGAQRWWIRVAAARQVGDHDGPCHQRRYDDADDQFALVASIDVAVEISIWASCNDRVGLHRYAIADDRDLRVAVERLVAFTAVAVR